MRKPREQAILMMEGGASPESVAAVMGVSVETARRWKLGEETRGRPRGLTEGCARLLPRLQALRAGGMSLREIGAVVALSGERVRQILKAGGPAVP